jgi:hypothetical protein
MLAHSMQLIAHTLFSPDTEPAKRQRLAEKIVTLYSKPTFLEYLFRLSDDPQELANLQILTRRRSRGEEVAGGIDEHDYQHHAKRHEELVKRAELFDKAYPEPDADLPPYPIPALPKAQLEQKVEQNGTSRPKASLPQAVEAALAKTLASFRHLKA